MSYVTIKAQDGSGAFQAYMAIPEATPAPAIIIIQEIFGVNAELRRKCDEWAEKGYVALCPDLFWRQEPGVDLTDQSPAEWDKAFKLMNGFDFDKGVEDLATTLGYIRGHESCSGKAANIGYCLGGNLSYQMACKTGIDCSVSFHGVGIENMLGDAVNIKSPLMMHIAEEDEYVSKEAQAVITAALLPHPHVTLYSYPGANHAFSRLAGVHYDENTAKTANQRTYDFIKTHIG